MENIKFIDLAIDAAVKAGNYAKKRKGSIKKISYKGDINLVTDVDKKCEELIVNLIKKYNPTHRILSEEGYRDRATAGYRWIIDPLDGTTNFAHGLPVYSVSIALEENGKIVVGVVYNPEAGELFTSEVNKGARLNNKKIHVSKINKLDKALLATGFAYDIKHTAKDNVLYFTKFLKIAQAVRRLSSAALDLCYVACGRFDGFWEMNLHPWDSAAAMLIVNEAGGRVTTFNNSTYTPFDKEILATNSKIHDEMVKILN